MKRLLNEFFTTDQAQLINNCIKGERKSQKILYDLYSAKMFHLCLAHSKNETDAELLLQRGFVKMFQNMKNFKFDRPFEDWVKTIFLNAFSEIRVKSS